MNTSRCVFSLMGLMGLVGLLAACGSDGAPSVSASGSGSGSASASGTITGFGSVVVNGKRFETSGASFTVDGQSGSQNDLKVGMTVVVNGSFNGNQRSASFVHQKDAVEGLVQSVAPDGLSLVVMGQTVVVDNTTIIDNNIPGQNILNLVAGTDNVEVNGHIRPNGIIQATFIEKKLANVTPEVRGFVSAHDDGTKTFHIGSLTVNYATAIINEMPSPATTSWNSLLVEVNGTVFNAATTTLMATKVEPDNQRVGNEVDEFEVEGFVTQVRGADEFVIGNRRVQTTGGTEFRGGTADEIVVGAKLSAEGRLVNGILIAKHVKFHESVRLEGDIAAIGTNFITIRGLSGITVTVDRQTEFKVSGGGTVDNLGDLNINDHVRVRGRVTGPDTAVATRIQLRSADRDVDLQGPVQSINGDVIVILGVSIDTGTIKHFESVSGTSMSRAGFLAEVRVNLLAKVKGTLNDTTVTWEEAELED